MNEKKGIKEILEMLEGMKVLAALGKSMAADGKINLADLPQLVVLVNNFGVLSAAINGMGELPAEAKDMDKEEAKQIVDKVFEIIEALKA